MVGLKHGTVTGYGYYSCRCDLCKEAHSKYQKEWKRSVWGKVGAPTHGTVSGYVNYGCRCVDCSRTKKFDAIKTRYGLTPKDVENLLLSQRGLCPLCGVSLLDRYVVDHSHETGEVRGLLCTSCNQALGKFQDDPKIIRRAIEYLS